MSRTPEMWAEARAIAMNIRGALRMTLDELEKIDPGMWAECDTAIHALEDTLLIGERAANTIIGTLTLPDRD